MNLQEVLPAAFGDIRSINRYARLSAPAIGSASENDLSGAWAFHYAIYSYSVRRLQLDAHAARAALLVMDDITDLLSLSEEVRRTQLHLASIVDSAGDLIISTDAAARS